MAQGGAFKDVILAVGIVAVVLGGLFAYTGVWPPMVVVESGSMMHGISCPPPAGEPEFCDPAVGYGKIGFIDPGDMVFVKRAGQRSDISTMAEAAARDPNAKNYGKPGDVVVYFNFERVPQDAVAREEAKKARTPIIHRAIAFVEVTGEDRDACAAGRPTGRATYSVFWEGQPRNFGSSGIYLPSMGFGGPRSPGVTETNGYKPCWSGFITKGDNPVTNVLPDQALGGGTLPQHPVEFDWVEGKAVGELPWFGLIKLALSSNLNYPCQIGFRPHDPACRDVVKIMNANSPPDLWVMLGVSLAVIAVAPLGYDMYLLQRQKKRAEAEARGETLPPGPLEGLILRIKDSLGGRKPPPGGDGEGGADPRRAFEPPREQAPQEPVYRPPPPPPSSSPPPPPPPSGGGTGAPAKSKFERVKKG